jgi:hypothetical protein
MRYRVKSAAGFTGIIIATDDPNEALARARDLEEQGQSLRGARRLMGDDFWSYGFGANKHVLDYFLAHHHRQGLSRRLLAPEELFHPATLESHRI